MLGAPCVPGESSKLDVSLSACDCTVTIHVVFSICRTIEEEVRARRLAGSFPTSHEQRSTRDDQTMQVIANDDVARYQPKTTSQYTD